jgi:hypothetical protein
MLCEQRTSKLTESLAQALGVPPKKLEFRRSDRGQIGDIIDREKQPLAVS